MNLTSRAVADSAILAGVDDPITILERLLDSSKWPTYRNRGQQSQLWRLAQEAYDRNTFDGYLSSVLIRSQSCEDFARILVQHAQFTLQICLALQGFGWHFAKRQTRAGLDKLMFGQLLDLLDHSIDFEAKGPFIAACEKLSGARNRLAHELDKGVSLQDIQIIAKECAELDEIIGDRFNDADEHFSWFYVRILDDERWDRLLSLRMESAITDELSVLQTLFKKLEADRENNARRY
jgi:hypothetical protein